MQRLRVYHAVLAVLVVLAFISGESGVAHAWVGYGVAAVIALRLVLALTGQPQLGLSRFYPRFQNLRLGTALTHPAISHTLLLAIACCLLAAAGAGVAMDQGRALGLNRSAPAAGAAPIQPAVFHGDEAVEEQGEAGERAEGRGEGGEQDGGPLGEAHELFANLLICLVIAHVSYLLLFKRPLVRFMLFIPPGRKA